MSKGFSINDILGDTKANAPAGQKMQVVMLPAADIEPNPENSIYEIGDVSMLKADIAERGLRSPLEVLPAKGGRYMLIAGHRRWTACRALTAEGVAGFEVLPCVIRQSQGEDDDLIALITSNATARELTDGERLRQYIALKQALERKKAAGSLGGRVRDEMSRITGDGTGTLGRLNAIANNCVPEVLAMVERGEITMGRGRTGDGGGGREHPPRSAGCLHPGGCAEVQHPQAGHGPLPVDHDERGAAQDRL